MKLKNKKQVQELEKKPVDVKLEKANFYFAEGKDFKIYGKIVLFFKDWLGKKEGIFIWNILIVNDEILYFDVAENVGVVRNNFIGGNSDKLNVYLNNVNVVEQDSIVVLDSHRVIQDIENDIELQGRIL